MCVVKQLDRYADYRIFNYVPTSEYLSRLVEAAASYPTLKTLLATDGSPLDYGLPRAL